jgi:hypothetical protein
MEIMSIGEYRYSTKIKGSGTLEVSVTRVHPLSTGPCAPEAQEVPRRSGMWDREKLRVTCTARFSDGSSFSSGEAIADGTSAAADAVLDFVDENRLQVGSRKRLRLLARSTAEAAASWEPEEDPRACDDVDDALAGIAAIMEEAGTPLSLDGDSGAVLKSALATVLMNLWQDGYGTGCADVSEEWDLAEDLRMESEYGEDW